MTTNQKDRRKFPRLPTTGGLPGPLYLKNGREITCKSTDVSKFGIGILTEMDLSLDVDLELKFNGQTILLKPVVKRRDSKLQNFFHIGLLVEGEVVDMEKLFAAAGCLNEHPVPKDELEQQRAKRFIPQKHLEFFATLLGMRDRYSFVVENISRTGILLSHPSHERPPFHVNTLLEMEIDSACTFISKPLLCTGKVVRLLHEKTTEGKERIVYGIMISDLDIDSPVIDNLIKAIEES